ncbi:hypothetical protein VTK26DRAFT_4946 [Humicola hyalothermophila]
MFTKVTPPCPELNVSRRFKEGYFESDNSPMLVTSQGRSKFYHGGALAVVFLRCACETPSFPNPRPGSWRVRRERDETEGQAMDCRNHL